MLALIYISFNNSLLDRIRRFGEKRNVNLKQYRLAQKLNGIYQSFIAYRNNKRALVRFFVLSFLENLLPILVIYCLSLAFHIELSLLYVCVLVSITLVLVRLPISISGIGVTEAAFVYFLGIVHIAPPSALLLGAAGNVIAILSILIGGILYAINGLEID
jgi:uncharacterized protein (TIRG00374 family)